jgi:hypothetical protein
VTEVWHAFDGRALLILLALVAWAVWLIRTGDTTRDQIRDEWEAANRAADDTRETP